MCLTIVVQLLVLLGQFVKPLGGGALLQEVNTSGFIAWLSFLFSLLLS